MAGAGVAKEVIPASRLFHGGARSAADIDSSGSVNGSDLSILLAAWGTAYGSADINRDGLVGGGDLAILLSAWTGLTSAALGFYLWRR